MLTRIRCRFGRRSLVMRMASDACRTRTFYIKRRPLITSYFRKLQG
jgi:hypothetical protein